RVGRGGRNGVIDLNHHDPARLARGGSRLCRELACEHAHRRSYAPSHSQPPLPPHRRNTTRAPSCSTSNSLAPALPGGLPFLPGGLPFLPGGLPFSRESLDQCPRHSPTARGRLTAGQLFRNPRTSDSLYRR